MLDRAAVASGMLGAQAIGVFLGAMAFQQDLKHPIAVAVDGTIPRHLFERVAGLFLGVLPCLREFGQFVAPVIGRRAGDLRGAASSSHVARLAQHLDKGFACLRVAPLAGGHGRGSFFAHGETLPPPSGTYTAVTAAHALTSAAHKSANAAYRLRFLPSRKHWPTDLISARRHLTGCKRTLPCRFTWADRAARSS